MGLLGRLGYLGRRAVPRSRLNLTSLGLTPVAAAAAAALAVVCGGGSVARRRRSAVAAGLA
eukprot:CAMPEP_0197888504 /NCGR_PEP_ID=MMETSP1439-20131203/22024_1 /TAXON_ID=66791 /ORGANISM="Gonyaulax spinifera, Strain CCMP409" /LENGTH=60 /DNA_ID=CAMNT_0043508419 /DNA_START=29 /DNA_END=211 /DNA_ORIENTATION=-